MTVVPAETAMGIHQLYGRQAHRIDSGDAQGWAATFTPAGVFSSPTYPTPVVGTSALVAFAERFTADALAAGEVRRHVVSTLAVDVCPRAATVVLVPMFSMPAPTCRSWPHRPVAPPLSPAQTFAV